MNEDSINATHSRFRTPGRKLGNRLVRIGKVHGSVEAAYGAAWRPRILILLGLNYTKPCRSPQFIAQVAVSKIVPELTARLFGVDDERKSLFRKAYQHDAAEIQKTI
jgi:hypothetical protein